MVSEQVLTYRDLMDIFINGDLAHVEPRKKLVYERWKSNPLGFPMMQFEFDNMLGRLLHAINYVAALSEQELATRNTQAPSASCLGTKTPQTAQGSRMGWGARTVASRLLDACC